MALNLDAALRVVAKVQGLNEFQALTESLEAIGTTSKTSTTGLQQLSTESNRLTQETSKTVGSVRAEAAALQELQTRSKASAADLRQIATDARGLGTATGELRGKSAGALDGLTASASKSATVIRDLGKAQAATGQDLQQLQGHVRAGAEGLNRMAAEAKGLSASASDLRNRTAGVLDGLTTSAASGAKGIRDLRASLQPTDAALAQLRDEVLALGAASKQSERSLGQQAAALKNLRSQAEVNGQLYNDLTDDIERLTNASKGMGQAVMFGVDGLAKLGSASQAGSQSVELQIKSLTRLQSTLVKGSEGYRAIGKEIDALKAKAATLDLSKGLNIPGALMGGVARSATSGISGAVAGIAELRRELAKTNPGRVVLAGEGIAAAGLTGAAGAGVVSGLGGAAANVGAVANSLDALAAKAQAFPAMIRPLGNFLAEPLSAAASSISQWGASLSAAQAKLAALAAPFEAIGTAVSMIGPEAAAAAGAASLAIASVYQVLSKQADAAQKDAEESFRGISDEAQRALTQLTRIYDRMPSARLQAQQELRNRNMQKLGEVAPDSVDARRAANAVVSAEREIAKIQSDQSALIEQARDRQNAQTESLKQQISVARERLDVQRKITAEARAEREQYAADKAVSGSIRRAQERQGREQERAAKIQSEENALIEQARQRELAHTEAIKQQIAVARDRLEVQRRLTAEIKASQAQYAAERATAGSIRRYQERQERDRQRLERAAAQEQADLARKAAAAFAPSATLALPAAGQTSFRGAVDARGFGGGARGQITNPEIPSQLLFDKAGKQAFMGSNAFSGVASSLNQQTQATQKARGALSQLFVEIDKVTASSNGSVNSLQRQRQAWENLRLAVNPAAPAYERARANVQRLDEQLKKLVVTQEREANAARRSIGREAIGGAMGALATGGGIQGAVGSLAGSLAFSGGPAGLLVGAGITAAAGASAFAARVGLDAETARVRLKALTDQFGEYNQAQIATARIAKTLRISTTEASDGFAQLYAALRPTGVTLKETEDAFIGFTAAARVSGATGAEASAALLQLKQALGSGVLQGDELRSIREQAPLVGQAIAKEMGVTVGELKKLGSEGKITTDIVLKALASLKDQNLDKLNAQFDTGAQAIKDLSNATQELGIEISKTFGPAAVATLRYFTRVLEKMRDPVGVAAMEAAAQAKAGTEAQAKYGRTGSLTNYSEYTKFYEKRYNEILEELKRKAVEPTSAPARETSDQKRAREEAAAERQAARKRTAMTEARQNLADQLKIRADAEKRLADFREQSILRAAGLERDLGDQRLQLERNTAEARRRIAAQELDAAAQRERYRLESAGLSTAGLDMRQRLDEADRRYIEQKIQIEQSAADKRVQIERTLEDYKLSVARGISEILQDAGNKLAQKMAAGGQAAAAAITGVSVPTGGIIARTGSTGQSTGPHLDARWADGRPITAADADRYLSVNGRDPSSFGVTSGYGPRSMFGRNFHYGMDFGTPSGSGIGLRNGATLLRDLGFTGAGGYAVEIDTPQGRMRLLHLQAGSAARPGGASAMPGMAGVAVAGRALDSALGANRAANLEVNAGELVASRGAALRDATGPLNQQVKSVREQRENFERILDLQRSGLTPELAQQAAERERMAATEREGLQILQERVTKDLQGKDLTAAQRADLQAILDSTKARLAAQPGILNALTAEEQKLEQLKTAYEQKKQLVQGIANSIGNGIGSALDLLINGTDDWGKSLREIAATVLKDIARQILQIMVIQPIVKGIASAFSFAFANGGIMTASGPVPLRAYAGGGVANSPQLALFGEGRMPEAYVPLPDGRRIPVALKGAPAAAANSNTSVVVNVDASGSEVQGDSAKAEQLGRVISQAVQQELIKQRRPGGLLTA